MVSFRRVWKVGGFLAVAAIVTCSHVWGEPRDNNAAKDAKDGNKPKISEEELDRRSPFSNREFTRFKDKPVVRYTKTTGEELIAVQLQPSLPAQKPRPRDYVVLIDTSASKGNGYLTAAQKLAETLIDKMGADDRVALWTANVEAHSLTKGEFKSKNQLGDAVKALAKEYPSGAVNLKKGLDDVIASFDGGVSRQRVILFLGDGNSTAGPLDGDSRAVLADKMVKREIAFFAVPLGARPYYANLHGFINATGGKVVRVEAKDKAEDTVARFLSAVAVPILYVHNFQMPAEMTDAMPTKLPPLRGDVPTLVVGKLTKAIKTLDYTITGTLGGMEIIVPVKLEVPAADVDNFFLANVIAQWREHKDRPALLQADRTLAYACDENQMARGKLLADADWALESEKYEHAHRLYAQALKVDPNSGEAKAGMKLVDDLRTGKITPDKLREQFKAAGSDKMTEIVKGMKGREKQVDRNVVLLGQPADGKQPEKKPDFNPPPVQRDVLDEVKARQAVAAQEAKLVVQDVIRRAARLVRTEPDAAHLLLKRTLEGVQTNPDLNPTVQIQLAAQLQDNLRLIDLEGSRVKQSQQEGSNLQAIADAHIRETHKEVAIQNAVKERLKAFNGLMEDARYEQAFDQARDMQAEMIEHGQQIPTALVAAYNQAQPAKHLQELHRLRKIREEKWLDVYMEVERSFMPTPDEPPIVYPTPAQIRKITKRYDGSSQFDNWADWSKYRIDKYAASTFGDSMPARGLQLRDQLSKPVDFTAVAEWTLKDALDWLTDRYDLTFDIYERAFADEGLKDVKAVNIAPGEGWSLKQVSLSTVLKKLVAKIPVAPSEATYIIRREAIEITTSKMAAYEKVVRVYPVADLLIFLQQGQQPGGSGINFGGTASGGVNIGGLAGGGFNLGGGGFNLAGGGGFNLAGGGFNLAGGGGFNLAGGGFNLAGGGGFNLAGGGFNLAGGGGFNLAGGGFNLAGGGFNLAGGGGFNLAGGGGFNLAGGGFNLAGGGGFNLAGGGFNLAGGGFNLAGGGGFNLAGGGGFNLAGGGINLAGGGFQAGGFQAGGLQQGVGSPLQGYVLIQLIKQVVGRADEWERRQFNPMTGQLDIVPPLGPDGQPRALLPGEELNNIVFFAPAQAIIVKGTSRITPRFRPPFPVQPGQVGGAVGKDDKKDPKDPVALNDPKKDPKVRVLPDGDKKLDPQKIWEEALAKGVENPSLIIAVADFLGQLGMWNHVSEFLKADLRQGIVVKPWVYETLAIALRNSGGSAEEIERAELSAVDLQPTDAQGFLKAAQTMADLKHYDRALAFCKQAALLEPNTPFSYDKAMIYAEATDDLKAMEWATSNLLKQDWPVRNTDIQNKAEQMLDGMAKRLDQKNRGEDSKKLRESVQLQRRRDLVIKLSWEGQADLDLKVKEPTGSTCWALNRTTVGGGTLVGDTLADMNNETYMAAEAFSGDYQITIDRVWGEPLYNKARLTVIRHQGSKDETIDAPLTVDLSKNAPITIKLDNGRRTEAAYVPPPSAQQTPDAPLVPQSQHDQILAQLRDLADPESYSESKGFRSGFGSPGSSLVEKAKPLPGFGSPAPGTSDKDNLYQTKVSSFVSNSLEVTAQAVMSADRRSMHLSISPVFAPLTANTADSKITTAVIP